MLSVILVNGWTHPSRAVDASIKAYRYRNKVRDAERYNVDFNYLVTVKGDVPAAIDAAKNVAALDPQIVFWGKYSNMLAQQRLFREAELAALRGLQWEENGFLYAFLANARFRAGKIDEARRTIAYGLNRLPSSRLLLGSRIDMLAAIGQYARADSLAHSLNANGATRAALDMVNGKLGEARQHLFDLRRANAAQGNIYSVVSSSVSLARLELEVAHDTARAIAIADSIPGTGEWRTLYPHERPYGMLAHFYVLAGKIDRAKALLADAERNVPPDYRARDQWLMRRTRAMVNVADGDASQVDEIRAAYSTDPQPNAALADLVWAYRRLGNSGEARKAAQAYLDELNPRRTEDDGYNLGLMRGIVSAPMATH
jgi:tetratricopeptide (TPR) repeat protein